MPKGYRTRYNPPHHWGGAPNKYLAEQEIGGRNAAMMQRIRDRKARGESNFASPPQPPQNSMDAMSIEELQVARVKSEFVEAALNKLIVDELLRRGIQA